MESKFQTSFIPKKSLDETSGVKVKTPISIFSLVAIILIALSVFLSAAVFAYEFIAKKQVASKKEELRQIEAGFDYGAVDEIVRVDSKLKSVENLLNSHIAVSNLFDFFEENTLQRLRFSDFTFSYFSRDRVVITMKGQAKSFEVVAKQSEAFSRAASAGENLRNPIFSDLNLDDSGNVAFSFLASVNPRLLQYASSMNEASEPIIEEVPVETAPAATSSPQI